MSNELLLRDLAAFAIQLAVIIGAGAALWRLFRVREAAISHAFWRLLLVACLLLPALQPWRQGVVSFVREAPRSTAAGDPIETDGPMVPGAPPRLPIETIILVTLGSGVLLRGLWLAAGAWNLRRLRRSATRLEPTPAIVREAETRVGARADVYVSDRISGPITFGLINPVVIIPPSVMTMEAALQDAIASHELLHVRRRDWLSVIGEEIVRTVFWFHPGIWWLIGRIQLSREHVVDEAVIRLTQSRDRYVEALLAVAKTGAPIALAPAPLFIRRRFLKKRVAQILQETTMTTRRLIASISVSASALAVAAVLIVRAFPLEAAQTPEGTFKTYAFTTTTSDSVQITRGGEHLLHASMPEYPKRAIEQRIEGDVVLDVTVDDRGEVSDARVASGPEELRRAALESVLNWHYSPDAVKSTSLAVALHFTVPDVKTYAFTTRSDGVEPETRRESKEQIDQVKAKIAEMEKRESAIDGARLTRIRTERVPQEVVQEITQQAGISIGDAISRDTIRKINKIAASIDEHISVRFEKDQQGGLVMILLAP